MNFEVASAPVTSSILKTKNTEIKEFELNTSLTNDVNTLFYE